MQVAAALAYGTSGSSPTSTCSRRLIKCCRRIRPRLCGLCERPTFTTMAHLFRSSLLLALALLPFAWSQGPQGQPSILEATGFKFGTGLCNSTFADFNATGVFAFNPNVLQGPQAGQNNTGRTQDSGIAVTIQTAPDTASPSNTTSSSYTLWWNTNGANYSENTVLGYDVRSHSAMRACDSQLTVQFRSVLSWEC